MNPAEYQQLRDEGHIRRGGITAKKSKDYAGIDVLSNFKRVAETCARLKVDVSKPEGVALFFVLHKTDRLAKLIGEGATPQNESLRDNADDLHNYVDLLEALLAEKEKPLVFGIDEGGRDGLNFEKAGGASS